MRKIHGMPSPGESMSMVGSLLLMKDFFCLRINALEDGKQSVLLPLFHYLLRKEALFSGLNGNGRYIREESMWIHGINERRKTQL